MTSENTTITSSTVGMKDGMAVNAQGNTGNVAGASQGSSVTQSHNGIKAGDLQALLDVLRQAKVPEQDLSNLQKVLQEETPPKEGALGEKVGGWIGGMIQKAVTGAWGMAVDKGSALLLGAIKAYFGMP